MKILSCGATRRRLHAFHDCELPVADQIAVSAHLEWCTGCADQYSSLRFIRAVLRDAAPGRAILPHDDPDFSAAVVSRLEAEETQSFRARIREMAYDTRLVYAGVGSALATAACLVIVLGMMRFATAERPDSLAAIMNLLASPGSNQYPVSIDPRTIPLPLPDRFRVELSLPVALDAAISARAAGDGDAVFALTAVVTREGRIENLDLLDFDDGGRPIAHEEQVVKGLMHAMSRTRFQPAQRQGMPVAVNIVWLVANTTVRAGAPEPPLATAPPIARGRKAASLDSRLSAAVG
ncbi:MAG: zf-HC2 domain-containing protein [Acidobacteria bacterium]|nr:zf-HC2 domain-containing protein [Acidobacteriota bacterium]